MSATTPLSKMNKKELYEECKKLKEENNKLAEQIDEYKDLIGDFPLNELEECINTYTTGENYIDECKSLQNQLDEEQYENNILRQQIKEVDKILDNEHLSDEGMIRSIIKALKLQGGAN